MTYVTEQEDLLFATLDRLQQKNKRYDHSEEEIAKEYQILIDTLRQDNRLTEFDNHCFMCKEENVESIKKDYDIELFKE